MTRSKKGLALASLCGLAWCQTGLTTIQDTLFRADGTRFNGTIVIQWNTFDAANIGTIIQQSRNVSIVNGNLQLQLAPNSAAQAPANTYTVQYQSDGRQQFTETWTVPFSVLPLTVSAVRTGTLSTGGAGGTGSQVPIPESSVVGLQADLNQRPVKGVGFGTNGVAVVDDSGILQTAAGQAGDCVLVDGTTGPCGAPTFVDAEIPGGIVDGSNGTFGLANTPAGTSLMMFRNGLYLTTGFDYTLTGSNLVFAPGAIPQGGDTLTASYRVDPSAAGNIGAISNGGPSVRATTMAQVICSAAGIASTSAAWTTLGACDIPAGQIRAGDRIEVRFTFAHTGMVSAFDLEVNWGTVTILERHASPRDSAVAGMAEAAITSSGAQVSVQSWGTVLAFLPRILSTPAQNGIRLGIRTSLSTAGTDNVQLTNYTVLRYPAN